MSGSASQPSKKPGKYDWDEAIITRDPKDARILKRLLAIERKLARGRAKRKKA